MADTYIEDTDVIEIGPVKRPANKLKRLFQKSEDQMAENDKEKEYYGMVRFHCP